MQVSGELSNDGQPMRRFMQTFVLAPGEVSTYTVIVQSINTLLFIYPLNVSELICLFKIRTCCCCFNAILLCRLISIFKRPPSWFQQGKVEIAAVTRVISWWSTFSILLPTSNLLSHKSWKTNSWFYLVCIALKHRKIRNKSLFSW